MGILRSMGSLPKTSGRILTEKDENRTFFLPPPHAYLLFEKPRCIMAILLMGNRVFVALKS